MEGIKALERERGKFQYYFFTPIYEKDLPEKIGRDCQIERITDGILRVKFSSALSTTPRDVLIFRQTDTFSVVVGTLKNRHEIESMAARLRLNGIGYWDYVPIPEDRNDASKTGTLTPIESN